MKSIYLAIATLFLGMGLITGCGTTTGGAGGTETGTTTGTTTATATTALAVHIKNVASSLVPNINATATASVSATKAVASKGDSENDGESSGESSGQNSDENKNVSYETEDNWVSYIDPSYNYILTDIFGSADVEPKVATKIRVLVDQFSTTVSNLFSHDPDITCANASALNEGDSITIAFYGTVANGTSTDRHFSCTSTDANTTTIYGRDSAGVVRIVTMSDNTSTNTTSPELRGDQVRIRSVAYSAYVEKTEGSDTVSYLDLDFAHGSSYNGPDLTFESSDDMIFKSRSQVTGRAVLDTYGTPTLGTGDFNVTKYDKNGTGDATITRALGRGSYGAGDYVLFQINSNASAVASLAGTFCLQMPSTGSGLPVSVAPSNCASLEDAHAWGGAAFPFDPLQAIDASFSNNTFYEDDGTEMITDAGDNFTIPTYQ